MQDEKHTPSSSSFIAGDYSNIGPTLETPLASTFPHHQHERGGEDGYQAGPPPPLFVTSSSSIASSAAPRPTLQPVQPLHGSHQQSANDGTFEHVPASSSCIENSLFPPMQCPSRSVSSSPSNETVISSSAAAPSSRTHHPPQDQLQPHRSASLSSDASVNFGQQQQPLTFDFETSSYVPSTFSQHQYHQASSDPGHYGSMTLLSPFPPLGQTSVSDNGHGRVPHHAYDMSTFAGGPAPPLSLPQNNRYQQQQPSGGPTFVTERHQQDLRTPTALQFPSTVLHQPRAQLLPLRTSSLYHFSSSDGKNDYSLPPQEQQQQGQSALQAFEVQERAASPSSDLGEHGHGHGHGHGCANAHGPAHVVHGGSHHSVAAAASAASTASTRPSLDSSHRSTNDNDNDSKRLSICTTAEESDASAWSMDSFQTSSATSSSAAFPFSQRSDGRGMSVESEPCLDDRPYRFNSVENDSESGTGSAVPKKQARNGKGASATSGKSSRATSGEEASDGSYNKKKAKASPKELSLEQRIKNRESSQRFRERVKQRADETSRRAVYLETRVRELELELFQMRQGNLYNTVAGMEARTVSLDVTNAAVLLPPSGSATSVVAPPFGASRMHTAPPKTDEQYRTIALLTQENHILRGKLQLAEQELSRVRGSPATGLPTSLHTGSNTSNLYLAAPGSHAGVHESGTSLPATPLSTQSTRTSFANLSLSIGTHPFSASASALPPTSHLGQQEGQYCTAAHSASASPQEPLLVRRQRSSAQQQSHAAPAPLQDDRAAERQQPPTAPPHTAMDLCQEENEAGHGRAL